MLLLSWNVVVVEVGLHVAVVVDLSLSFFIYLCLWEDGYILMLQGSL